MVTTVTADDYGRDWHAFQVSAAGRNMGTFPSEALTDAVAVILASSTAKGRDQAARKDLANWWAIASKLAARKATSGVAA